MPKRKRVDRFNDWGSQWAEWLGWKRLTRLDKPKPDEPLVRWEWGHWLSPGVEWLLWGALCVVLFVVGYAFRHWLYGF